MALFYVECHQHKTSGLNCNSVNTVSSTNLDNTDRLARKMVTGIYEKCEQQNKYLMATNKNILI